MHTQMIPPFYKMKNLQTKVLNNFNIMIHFSGLKINKSKCEVAAIGVMKGVKMTLCGLIC